MGYPMARNLLRAGHEVALWSNHGEKARKLAGAEKGRCCATPKEVAENADCIFLCVGDTEMVRAVILGPDGIGAGAHAGAVVADASTISPSESRKIGAILKRKGIELLDAPCTGSTPGAESGTLTFMVGGDTAVFEGGDDARQPAVAQCRHSRLQRVTQCRDHLATFVIEADGRGRGHDGADLAQRSVLPGVARRYGPVLPARQVHPGQELFGHREQRVG